jgi:hypothetical protein
VFYQVYRAVIQFIVWQISQSKEKL